ncbi:type I-C CRISPR-associated protein Cas7/Csd2 [Micromonospora fluostatini]|uniref:Type I-C CRISPR-associated protein Cas7/Csd2 n=1 Tax=Micromonospora fluostatini TaxID=1629071 RepID=A0ABY2DM72_9ACTN|nr:type I-C CRISPR-associated protein Cas7/Csd2 [Micromonospora fluostatini]
MSGTHLDPTRRHDAVVLFEVTDANPNGDPDAENQPRTDDETGHGLVTDVSMKRRIRDTVAMLHGDDERFQIFVEARSALNPRWEQARAASKKDDKLGAVQRMCAWYFDVRMFGAVLTGGGKGASAQVRGPVQMGFARSLHPVLPSSHMITRVTQTRQEDIDKGERNEIGSKWTVPYGLYRAHLHYSAPRGMQTGVTEEDMAALWRATAMMFECTRSATGVMDVVGLHVFTHQDAFGAAPSKALFGRVRHESMSGAPRKHTDYEQAITAGEVPGVTMTTLVDAWAS